MLRQNETNIGSHVIKCGKKMMMFIYNIANEDSNSNLQIGSTKKMIEDRNEFIEIIKKQNNEMKKDNDFLFKMRDNMRVNLEKLETFKKIYNKREHYLKKCIKILELSLLISIVISFGLGFVVCRFLFVNT
jgi:hypothetical protein